jgi:NifU-like protein involved in Fe-S cluster formation
LPTEGQAVEGPDGLRASFSLNCQGQQLERISFKASTCITLVAYCEALSELAEGQELRTAIQITPIELVARLPQVPELKRDRASLAVRALQSAIVRAVSNKGANP